MSKALTRKTRLSPSATNEDRKRRHSHVVIGLLWNLECCPPGVEVLPRNTHYATIEASNRIASVNRRAKVETISAQVG